MRPVMVKVFGFLRPLSENEVKQLAATLNLPDADSMDVFERSGELVNFSYEGIYFPIEDFIAAAKGIVEQGASGKVDYIDMEAWKITRYLCENGAISSSERGLNNVMAYSGH